MLRRITPNNVGHHMSKNVVQPDTDPTFLVIGRGIKASPDQTKALPFQSKSQYFHVHRDCTWPNHGSNLNVT